MYPGINDFGLRTISACLKQAGHDVDLFFLMKEFHKKYSETAMNNLVKLTKGSDLARISVMSNFFDNAIQVTQKLTRKLYLHKFLRNVIWSLLPIFRYIGQSTRPSTRLYKYHNVIKFNGSEGEATYRTNALNEFDMKMDLNDFHCIPRNYEAVKPPWLERKFRKMKLMLFKARSTDIKARIS